MASRLYQSFQRDVMCGRIDLENDTIKVMLVGEHYKPSRKHKRRSDIVGEVAGNGYAPGGLLLTGKRVEERADGVSVTLNNGERRDVALVVGCDGNRSNTRRLVFGGGDQFTHFMGGYFFLKVVPETGLLPADTTEVFRTPGRMAMLNGYDDRTDIGFGFRTTGEIDYDYRDRRQQRRLIHERFDGLGWKVPAMLAGAAGDDDFYFDRINQIRMPTWSRGRVTLVGDAGYCVSPLAGFGGSMAIIGAGRLAAALEQYPSDHAAAFRHYEDGLRPFVEEVQERAASDGMSMMCPADEGELAERDQKIAAGDIGF